MLSPRYDQALVFASDLHRSQTRKGTDIPYLSHLLAVSSLVLEHGGDEDQAISGLLHDAVEDQGGLATARLISERFGPRVASIVLGCTDQVPGPEKASLPWRERKAAFIERVANAPQKTALVITCDKLHNISCLVSDVRSHGPGTLSRFSRPASILWYYTSLSQALSKFRNVAPVDQLLRKVNVFTDLVAGYELPSGGTS